MPTILLLSLLIQPMILSSLLFRLAILIQSVKVNPILVAFKLKLGLTAVERVKIRRRLYGYFDFAQFGRYRYARERILALIPHQRILPRFEKKDLNKILKVLKGKTKIWLAEYMSYFITLTESR